MRPLRSSLIVVLVLITSLTGATVAQGAPSDPLYSKQWGSRQVRAEQAWAKSRGTGVVIGIVDSGVDLDHPDLAAKMLTGKTFLGCGNTGCGNGDWQSGPNNRRKFDSPTAPTSPASPQLPPITARALWAWRPTPRCCR